MVSGEKICFVIAPIVQRSNLILPIYQKPDE